MSNEYEETGPPLRPPAISPQARENELITLATDLAERQLRQGNASAQVITHYLKLATVREELEREKLFNENQLLRIKAETLESNKKMETVYEEALEAMRRYSGEG